jgi:hypothetical protein
MVVCEFSYSLLIQTVGVVGTLAIAALAIWGEQIRHRVAGPKLRLRLHDPEGGLTTWTNGTKVRYYHLYVENRRPHAPATRVKVMMREYSSCGPHGKFIRDANHIPIQLQYEFPNLPNHDSRPTIGSATLCDIGFVTEREDFRFATYFVPHTFKSVLKPNERVRILVRAEAENALSNEILLEIAWSGVWKEDTLQMAKNLVIGEISNRGRER